MLQNHYSTSKSQTSIPIYASGRAVGHVTGTVFVKSIHGSKHMLRQPPAIAIGQDALSAAIEAGATDIRVIDQDDGTVYKATVSHFRANAFRLDRGYGPQLALKLTGWTREKKRGGLEQLTLFGGAA